MKQKKIRNIIQHKIDSISKFAADVDKDFDKEAIHKFRVATKSLRSFLRLQKMFTGNSKIKLTKKTKRIYSIAGIIREAQLEMDFIKNKASALPHYVHQLNAIVNVQKEKWQQHYSEKAFQKLGKKLTDLNYCELPPGALEQFFSNRVISIHQLALSSAPADAEVHEARKKIKDILYNAEIAKKKWKSASKKTDHMPKAELDALSHLIGDYNDERIILDHVKSFPVTGLDPAEKGQLKHFKDKETKKLRKKKDAVLTATKNLLDSGTGQA